MKSETACAKASAWWWRKKLVQKLTIINWRGEAFLSWCTSKVAFIFIYCNCYATFRICPSVKPNMSRLHPWAKRATITFFFFSKFESWRSNATFAEYTEMYLILNPRIFYDTRSVWGGCFKVFHGMLKSAPINNAHLDACHTASPSLQMQSPLLAVQILRLTVGKHGYIKVLF